jgi:hypothetical protein
LATENGIRLEQAPVVVIAWVPSPVREAEAPHVATRSDREAWITAITAKLGRSGRVARAEGVPPATFEEGVALTGLQTLATDRRADLIVLFGLDVAQRRYHVLVPTEPTSVADVIEVRTTARAIGMTPTGRPVFAETQVGFNEGNTLQYAQVEDDSERAAVDAMAAAIIRRIDQMTKGKRSS